MIGTVMIKSVKLILVASNQLQQQQLQQQHLSHIEQFNKQIEKLLAKNPANKNQAISNLENLSTAQIEKELWPAGTYRFLGILQRLVKIGAYLEYFNLITQYKIAALLQHGCNDIKNPQMSSQYPTEKGVATEQEKKDELRLFLVRGINSIATMLGIDAAYLAHHPTSGKPLDIAQIFTYLIYLFPVKKEYSPGTFLGNVYPITSRLCNAFEFMDAEHQKEAEEMLNKLFESTEGTIVGKVTQLGDYIFKHVIQTKDNEEKLKAALDTVKETCEQLASGWQDTQKPLSHVITQLLSQLGIQPDVALQNIIDKKLTKQAKYLISSEFENLKNIFNAQGDLALLRALLFPKRNIHAAALMNNAQLPNFLEDFITAIDGEKTQIVKYPPYGIKDIFFGLYPQMQQVLANILANAGFKKENIVEENDFETLLSLLNIWQILVLNDKGNVFDSIFTQNIQQYDKTQQQESQQLQNYQDNQSKIQSQDKK